MNVINNGNVTMINVPGKTIRCASIVGIAMPDIPEQQFICIGRDEKGWMDICLTDDPVGYSQDFVITRMFWFSDNCYGLEHMRRIAYHLAMFLSGLKCKVTVADDFTAPVSDWAETLCKDACADIADILSVISESVMSAMFKIMKDAEDAMKTLEEENADAQVRVIKGKKRRTKKEQEEDKADCCSGKTEPEEGTLFVYNMKKKGIQGECVYRNGKYVIKAGSEVNPRTGSGFKRPSVESFAVQDEMGKWTVVQDMEFNAPSIAVGTMAGVVCSGYDYLKEKETGKPLWAILTGRRVAKRHKDTKKYKNN